MDRNMDFLEENLLGKDQQRNDSFHSFKRSIESNIELKFYSNKEYTRKYQSFHRYKKTYLYFLEAIQTILRKLDENSNLMDKTNFGLGLVYLLYFIDTPFNDRFHFDKSDQSLCEIMYKVLRIINLYETEIIDLVGLLNDLAYSASSLKREMLANIEKICFIVKFLFEFTSKEGDLHFKERLYAHACLEIERYLLNVEYLAFLSVS